MTFCAKFYGRMLGQLSKKEVVLYISLLEFRCDKIQITLYALIKNKPKRCMNQYDKIYYLSFNRLLINSHLHQSLQLSTLGIKKIKNISKLDTNWVIAVFHYILYISILLIHNIMKYLYFCLLTLLTTLTLSDDPFDDKRTKIPEAYRPFSGVFVALWLGGHCTNSKYCDKDFYDLWDRCSFTIHGLWPSPKASIPYDDFNLDSIEDQHLLDDMQNFWPHQYCYNAVEKDPLTTQLWNHEYNKHGKDLSQIIQIYQPQELFTSQDLQQKYIQTTIDLYQSLNLQKLFIPNGRQSVDGNGIIVTKAELANIIGVDERHFLAMCWGSKNLNEIHICHRVHQDILSQDLAFTFQSCESIKKNGETPYPGVDTCPQEFNLVGYVFGDQRRVTARKEFNLEFKEASGKNANGCQKEQI